MPSGPEPPLSVDLRDTYKVAQLVGPGSINDTDTRWDVYGADLGHMFLANGRMLVTFGDTFGGPPAFPFFSVSHTGHRGNTMGWVDPAVTRPADGLELAGMITGTFFYFLLKTRQLSISHGCALRPYCKNSVVERLTRNDRASAVAAAVPVGQVPRARAGSGALGEPFFLPHCPRNRAPPPLTACTVPRTFGQFPTRSTS